ncbi:hypothetical protein BWI97_11560 [Siphonobacter sp. BAB-5405]|uniref:helix-turn-helix domain-containing protein n=1 Tax=Siphonobacter sp. BAB-5405 TaxID=1864825 RepID=UPI000C80948A|nr:helix-turn-helix transcriptional regulator [Siphonobacter sp. BAB-5405]PMD96436.1 hypothetical protein BWI97_11560 [Siphonobacter sp. BAB-5405]
MKYIIEKIRNIRHSKGYSQEYMSFELGISQTAYSRIELGKVKLDLIHLQRISEVFGIPIHELINPNEQVLPAFLNQRIDLLEEKIDCIIHLLRLMNNDRGC